MFCVLVRIVSFTERSTPGYCIEPPKPPNAGMQNEPPLVLSITLIFPNFFVVRCPLQVGGPVTSRAAVADAGTVPLIAVCDPPQPASIMTATQMPKAWRPVVHLIIARSVRHPGIVPAVTIRASGAGLRG